MNILVCGGAGYIGSHIVRRLLREGHSPAIVDSFSTGHDWAVTNAFKGFGEPRVFRGDLLDKAFLADVFRQNRFDAVMHFAGRILVGESVHNPGLYYDNNVCGTLNLLQAMAEAGVLLFVFSSTCAVFGMPETMPVTENLRRDPINPYASSKLMTEMMLADFATAHGMKSLALRYFNAAGAAPEGDLGEDHEPESHLIPNAIKAALGQGPALHIFGNDYPTPDGTCLRDYVHVNDLATAHVAALEYLANAPEYGLFKGVNLGTGTATSVLEVLRSVEAVGGVPVPCSFAPRREGDSPALYAGSGVAQDILRWKPEYTDINDIVKTAWNWHANGKR